MSMIHLKLRAAMSDSSSQLSFLQSSAAQINNTVVKIEGKLIIKF
jgi:hypothetical protein